MTYTLIRIRLPTEKFLKYKVFCAMENKSMTDMTQHILMEYVKNQNEIVKIIKTKE